MTIIEPRHRAAVLTEYQRARRTLRYQPIAAALFVRDAMARAVAEEALAGRDYLVDLLLPVYQAATDLVVQAERLQESHAARRAAVRDAS